MVWDSTVGNFLCFKHVGSDKLPLAVGWVANGRDFHHVGNYPWCWISWRISSRAVIATPAHADDGNVGTSDMDLVNPCVCSENSGLKMQAVKICKTKILMRIDLG